jgi:hypothetical protein
MTDIRLHRPVAVLSVGVAMATLLVACGNDKPAVCSDLEGLKQSVQNLKDVSLQAGALAKVQQDITAISQQFTTFKHDAKSEFAPDIEKVQSAVDDLSTTAGVAKQSPSLSHLASVGTATAALSDAVKSLGSAVSGTCGSRGDEGDR